MPIEPALRTSAGRMPKRSSHGASEGRMPERASGEMAWAWPRAAGTNGVPDPATAWPDSWSGLRGARPMPIEPALRTSAGRMPKRSSHGASEGRMPERASGEMAWAWPRAAAPTACLIRPRRGRTPGTGATSKVRQRTSGVDREGLGPCRSSRRRQPGALTLRCFRRGRSARLAQAAGDTRPPRGAPSSPGLSERSPEARRGSPPAPNPRRLVARASIDPATAWPDSWDDRDVERGSKVGATRRAVSAGKMPAAPFGIR
jgi:hypothetical protein